MQDSDADHSVTGAGAVRKMEAIRNTEIRICDAPCRYDALECSQEDILISATLTPDRIKFAKPHALFV